LSRSSMYSTVSSCSLRFCCSCMHPCDVDGCLPQMGIFHYPRL
jgi:hypothetical protein